jgi:hypothetical protein
MRVSWRCYYIMIDDTTNFTKTGGPLKIKDQAVKITHEDVRPNKQYMKCPIVTSG